MKNEVPPFDVPTYSVHVDTGIHFCFHNSTNAGMLLQKQFRPPADTQFSARANPTGDSNNESLFSDYNSDNDSLFSDVSNDV